jgi:hypothetical protein
MGPRASPPWALGLAVRVTNLVVTALGLGLVAYGLYLVVDAKSLSVMSGLALALGSVDALLGLAMLCCGSASLFYLRLYGLVLGLVELGQVAVAVMFILPQTQGRIIETINPPDNLRAWIQANLSTTGYVLLGIVAFQAVALLLVFAQACVVDRAFDEEAVADNEALLGRAGASYLSSFGYAARGKTRVPARAPAREHQRAHERVIGRARACACAHMRKWHERGRSLREHLRKRARATLRSSAFGAARKCARLKRKARAPR